MHVFSSIPSLMGSLRLLSRHIGDHTRQVTRISCSVRQSQALETSSYLSAGDDFNESMVELGEVCSQSMSCCTTRVDMTTNKHTSVA